MTWPHLHGLALIVGAAVAAGCARGPSGAGELRPATPVSRGSATLFLTKHLAMCAR